MRKKSKIYPRLNLNHIKNKSSDHVKFNDRNMQV